ncbi:unnamed protein product [Amoebophrya sp. A25]|nr:unnamed protein product [Amoebophrya sp. A25]|eukprot:GSA25T00008769001.1
MEASPASRDLSFSLAFKRHADKDLDDVLDAYTDIKSLKKEKTLHADSPGDESREALAFLNLKTGIKKQTSSSDEDNSMEEASVENAKIEHDFLLGRGMVEGGVGDNIVEAKMKTTLEGQPDVGGTVEAEFLQRCGI